MSVRTSIHDHQDCYCWTDTLLERLGGKSTVHVDLGPEGKGRFWGKLSNELNPGRRRDGVLEKGGYAGFRNKVRALCPLCRMPDGTSR